MLQTVSLVSDRIEHAWEQRPWRLARAGSLVLVLLGGVGLIELSRRGMLSGFGLSLPRVHLAAVAWAVTLLLVFEIVDMVLALRRSVATTVARHLQLYALVLLRDAFLKLGVFGEPIEVLPEQHGALAVMGADAIGSIVLFSLSVLFSRIQRHQPIVSTPTGGRRFVALKQLIGLGLLATLAGMCVIELVGLVRGSDTHRLFDGFFTVLIFTDVLLAFVSLGFTEVPAVVFRNFGFALAAILLRLSLAAPEFARPLLGVAGGVVAIAVSLAYTFALHEGHAADRFADERRRLAAPAGELDGSAI